MNEIDYRNQKDHPVCSAKSLKDLIMYQHCFGQNSKGAIEILVCLYTFSKFVWVWRLYLQFQNQLESAMPQRNDFVEVMTA